MHRSSKLAANLSPSEKRALLAQLLQQRAAEPLALGDHFETRVTNLQGEVLLDPTISPRSPSVNATTEPAHVFLTGATGFLGVFLLAELLQHSDATVHCLIRCGNAEEGRRRLEKMLKAYSLPADVNARVVPVPGDLSKPLFGLSDVEFRKLAGVIDTIFHSGALVNWVYPYKSLKGANVLGTQEVLRLAVRETVKPVHFVSTIAVFPIVASSGVRVFREEDTIDHGGILHGGYAQSKWVAERLVAIAHTRGIPVSIHRAGLISGHSQTGVCNENDLVFRLIKTSIELRGAPELEGTLNLVPVDYVSKAIVYLSRTRASLGNVFHLVNSHPVTYRKLLGWIRSYGYAVDPIPYKIWRAMLMDLGRLPDSGAYYLVPLFMMNVSERGPNIVSGVPEFDCEKTLNRLAGSGIVCPPLDAQLFETYFSYLIRRGFLNPPPTGWYF